MKLAKMTVKQAKEKMIKDFYENNNPLIEKMKQIGEKITFKTQTTQEYDEMTETHYKLICLIVNNKYLVDTIRIAG